MLAPRENLKLVGHQEERDDFLRTFHSDRFPHGWIVAGPCGIGKATFVFHMARYILSGRQDKNTSFSEKDPLYRRIVVQSHGDLWTLGGEDAQEIDVDSVRKLNGCLNQTTAEGGWRVVVIDGANRLNRNAANALLKRLEEPPPKTVFFLITGFPGHLLPTIRSRCQTLSLNPLNEEEVKEALQFQGLPLPDYFSISLGSPGRLIRLMEGEGPQIYKELQKLLEGGAATSFVRDYGKEEASYNLVEDLLRNFLHHHLLEKIKGKTSFFKDYSLEKTLIIQGKIEGLFDQCRFAQLDRKATLTCVFANLQNRNAS